MRFCEKSANKKSNGSLFDSFMNTNTHKIIEIIQNINGYWMETIYHIISFIRAKFSTMMSDQSVS